MGKPRGTTGSVRVASAGLTRLRDLFGILILDYWFSQTYVCGPLNVEFCGVFHV
jgi:hypothetical protein